MSDDQSTPVLEASESIAELADALAKAQGAMEGAAKDAKNPFFRSKYADLASICAAAKGPLAANGLSVVQVPGTTRLLSPEQVTVWDKQNKKEHVKTIHPCEVFLHSRLLHLSGEWIGGTLSMRSDNSDPQSIGSCLTYARRYAMAALVGIAPEDDDGEQAMGRGRNTQARKPNGNSHPRDKWGPDAKPVHDAAKVEQTRKAIEAARGDFGKLWDLAADIDTHATNGTFSADHRNELQGLVNLEFLPLISDRIDNTPAEKIPNLTKWIVGRGFSSNETGDFMKLVNKYKEKKGD